MSEHTEITDDQVRAINARAMHAIGQDNELHALREDVARLTKLNEQLMEDIMKIRDHALDYFEFIEAVQSPPAALTPQAGKGGGE